MLLQILTFGLCAVVAGALDLPPYIKPCAYDDPNLNDCALREARETIKFVVNGDSKYRIPKLEPLLIQELKIEQGSKDQAIGFSLVAQNCTMSGLSGTKILAIRFDFKNHHIQYDLDFPRLEIIANYSANGRLLLLPLTGTGIANITLVDVKPTYRYNYTLDKKADGDYLVITDNKLDYKLDGRVYMRLNNLLNGQPALVDSINTALNDNWQELVKEFGPGIADALAQVLTTVLKSVFSTVSMQKAFPGHP